METKKITHEESLEIITKMVSSTRGSIRGVSFYFLFWGWVATIANLGQYLIGEFTDYAHPYIIWLIAIPGTIYTFWYGSRAGRKARVQTYGSHMVYQAWIAFVIAIVLCIFFGSYFNYQITALVMLFIGMATWVTGAAIDYNPMRIGAVVFWVLTPVALLAGQEFSPLVMVAALIGGYLIPGYMLKNAD